MATQLIKNCIIKTATVCFAVLCLFSSNSYAEAPGGPDCGWGNMLFEGDKGGIPHTVAYLTNGLSSFNTFFGIVFGTNGCTTDGTLTYKGEPMLGLNHILDELVQDIARGSGEALNALSVAMKIEKQDRDHFDKVMHENFESIFPHENMQAQHIINNISDVMKKDARLKAYAS